MVAEEPRTAVGSFRIGDASVDLDLHQITRDDETHNISPKEAHILALLHSQEGHIVSRERFLASIWGSEEAVSHRTIDTHILNVRAKLEKDPRQPRHLLTVHGVGYRLVR